MRSSHVRAVAALIVLVLVVVPATALAGVTLDTTTLSLAKFYALRPSLSGKLVAWMEQPTSTSDYQVWVRRANGTSKKVSGSYPVNTEQGPTAFGARWVVWSEWIEDGVGGRQWNLKAYDDLTDTTAQLTETTDPQVCAAGNGMTLIWVSREAAGNIVKTGLMPGLTSVRTVATHPPTATASDTCLYGSQAGYVVAQNGAPGHRHYLTTSIDVPLVDTVAEDDGTNGPEMTSISNAWWAWDQIVGGEYRAFAKHRSSGVSFQLPGTITTTGQSPSVYSNMVAWSGVQAGPGGVQDVFLLELLSDHYRKVSTGGDTRYVGMNGRRVAYTQRIESQWDTKLATYTLATDRIPGADRFVVSADAARAAFGGAWTGVDYVVVASGDDAAAADPLAAAGLCWKYDAPLLLVSATKMPEPTWQALKQIKAANPAARVIVVGGAGSVPEARMTQMKSVFGTPKVERLLATGDRYDMAAKIAERMRTGTGGKTFPADPVALIANGADRNKFFDALSLSAVARASGNPILLVKVNALPAATKNALSAMHPQGVVVAGGTGTVNASVYSLVHGTARWWGADRYLTSKAVAEGAIANGYNIPSSIAVVAKLPDGVSGGAMVGRDRGVLLVTKGTGLSAAAGDFAGGNFAEVWHSTALGGTGSIANAVLTQLDGRLNP